MTALKLWLHLLLCLQGYFAEDKLCCFTKLLNDCSKFRLYMFALIISMLVSRYEWLIFVMTVICENKWLIHILQELSNII